MHMRMCRISYYSYQHRGHPTHSNCHTYTCILERTHSLTLKAVRQNLHLTMSETLAITNYLHTLKIYIPYKRSLFHSPLCILARYLTLCTHLHSKRHSILSYIIHTLLGISYSLYLPMYLPTIEKHFPHYLGAKYQSWGSPNSYKQIPIFMLF